MPTTATRYDMAVSEFEKYLRVKDIQGLEELVSYRLELGRVCIRDLRTCSASGILGPSQAGTGLRNYVILARECGAPLEDLQNVFRTLWSVHQSWFPRHPG